MTSQETNTEEATQRVWVRLIAFTAVPAVLVFAIGTLVALAVSGSFSQLSPAEMLPLRILLVAGLGLLAEVLSVGGGLLVVYSRRRPSGLDSWHALVAGTASSCLLTLLGIVVVLVV